MRLTLVDGPECPDCGCRDGETLATNRWCGRVTVRRRCRYCRRVFTANSEADPQSKADGCNGDGVPFVCVRCPVCGSEQVRVTSTQRPVRHHKCQACGNAFKSVEGADG